MSLTSVAEGRALRRSDPGVQRSGDRRAYLRSHHLEILLASFAALLVEISYTRVISFKLFYYYVYLVIGLAMLGLGLGGVLVAVSRRLRSWSTDAVLFGSFTVGAVVTVGVYVGIAFFRIDTLAVWRYGTGASTHSFVTLLLMCLGLLSCFVAPGVIVASLFGRRPERVGGLYFADLVGAALACALVVLLISRLGAPATVMLAAAVMAGAAMLVGARLRPAMVAPAAVVTGVAVLLTVAPGLLPAQRLDSSKTAFSASAQAYSGWGPILRVDAARLDSPVPQLLLFHDGILGAAIWGWDGKASSLAGYGFEHDTRAFPFDVLGRGPSQELIVGAAGGHEVLASLAFGARHVDAVELNPLTVDLVRNRFAAFDGHLAQNPRVDYVTGDGRSFLARTARRYDLVWYPAPDSYAATNGALASAYVLSESYLYTTNALVASLQHLRPGGIVVAQFGEVDTRYDLRTTRFVATARQALADIGVPDARDHILVAQTQNPFLGATPPSTIVVSRTPFTSSEIEGFLGALRAVPGTSSLYAPEGPVTTSPVRSYMATPNDRLPAYYATFPYDITPTTDNDPFFWHFARFGTVLSHYASPLSSVDRENAVGERVLLLLVGVSAVVAALLLLLPFAVIRRTWAAMPRKGSTGLFFAGLGFGFMFFEITLMQLLNLFLGYPTYALTVTLMALLVCTGLGAAASSRVRRPKRTVAALVVVVAALCLFYLTGLTPLTTALLGTPFGARVVVSFLVLAPLGLCLGMFMPLGLREIAQRSPVPQAYVAWGWAVNGFASVVGSALATVLAMSFGFDTVLGLGLACYVAATAGWMAVTRTSRGDRFRPS